ncbi:MAG: hypothetical protein PF447_12090 [Spirochaetaceae bacterium]|jgi:peptidoglycan/xylan/chitin deacetylase (PgdA/CDA1 family)|nr:hypothetical protein [Spirochaetaceae bacterium]
MKYYLVLFLSLWLLPLVSQERELPIKLGVLDPVVFLDHSQGDLFSSSGGSLEKLALTRILSIQGIPFEILEENDDFGKYSLILTAGAMDNPNVSPELMNRLFDYVEMGGSLLSSGSLGNKLYTLFGVENHWPSQGRYRLNFIGAHESLYYLDRPEERTISLGNGEEHFYDEVIWTHGYEAGPSTVVLGEFDDQTAGFLVHSYGRGKAYLLGVSYVDSVLLPQRNGDFQAQRSYVNSFEPSADVIMLIIKALYQKCYVRSAVISVIPQGRSQALLLSHDVDAQTSFVDALKYARLEGKFHVTSSFFINTKTFIDAADIDYYNIRQNQEAVMELHNLGADIGSHTVAHYIDFSHSPLGAADVRASNYHPENEITVYGEVRVSKELLDGDIPGLNTLSFRAGYLQFPKDLIRVLQQSGYLYDSTFSANDTLTAFPYFALEEQDLSSRESSIVEIPVTMDDSREFLTPDSLDSAVSRWIDICDANGNNGGISVLLIHSSDTRDSDYKLRAQEQLMNHLSRQQGWMGNIAEFGQYWRQRQDSSFKMFQNASGGLILQLNKTAEELHPWIAFELKGRIPSQIMVRDSLGVILDYQIISRGDGVFLRLRSSDPLGRYP